MGLRVFVLCLFITLNTLLVYKVVWGSTGFLAHQELMDQYRAAVEDCRRIDAENKALSRDIRLLLTDDAYIEKMVRERLHYLHDNEILYIFGEDNGSDKQVRAPEASNERKN